MGVWGWDEIQDGVKLQGFIIGNAFVEGDDSDWNFNVSPARGFTQLLTNAHGNSNQDKQIQCEVKPPQHLKDIGVDVGSDAVANGLLGLPFPTNSEKQWATVEGTFAVDKGHSVFDGSDILVPGGDSTIGKTEIHPVTSVLVEHLPAADNSSRSIDFLVFSDDSKDRTFTFPPVLIPPLFLPQLPITVSTAAPHAAENRSGGFDIPIPLGSGFTKVSIVDKSQSQTLALVDSGRFQTLRCRVSSGTPQDGKGFFHVRVTLPGFTVMTYLLSRGIDPKAGVRELMSRDHIPSIKALFQRLDAGTLEPLACVPLLAEIAALQNQINTIAGQMKALQEGPGPKLKPKQDPAFVELEAEQQKLENQQHALEAKAQALGCLV